VDYAYPEGIETFVDEPGGRVPHGMPIKTEQGQFSPLYKQWRWENFWQSDIRTYVGKPLPAYVTKAA
jgi:hypothetical protein